MEMSKEIRKEIEMFHKDKVEQFMKVNKITKDEAVELIYFDMLVDNEEITDQVEKEMKENKKKKAQQKKATTGVQEWELDLIKEVIKKEFSEREFKNKELHIFVSDKFSVRQTPSRLKRLVKSGFLVDCGGSPKSYKINK